MDDFRFEESFALRMDGEDPLADFRDLFHIPPAPDGSPTIYLCGNSLGLQPKGARDVVEEELADWALLGVKGHHLATRPWYDYHARFAEPAARLVGALPTEVVMMNSLTVNLHLMLTSFYRPEGRRRKILIEYPAFSSDVYAVKTQLRLHGVDPAEGLVQVGARKGEHAIDEDDIEAALAAYEDEIACVLIGGVNFLTGQLFDMPRIARAAREAGCTVGFDLAHAVGNVPLSLHDWDVDFAVWCNYKYVNAGPGSIAGCFVHERHGRNPDLPRFGGWWGVDPETRFQLHLLPDFVPVSTAEGWQLSNPPILAMAPLVSSLEIFDEAGMPALREKSVRLTGYLEGLLSRIGSERVEIITPLEPERRGCQISIRVRADGQAYQEQLVEAGIVCDFREPDIIRVAPTPLYNTFHEAWRFAQVLAG